MNLLMISTDRSLFEEDSAVRLRTLAYAKSFTSLHVIVLSRKGHKLSEQKIGDNVWLHPTHSLTKFNYFIDAPKIGNDILHVDAVTAQDPFETGLIGLKIARKRNIPFHAQIHTDFLSPYFARGGWVNKLRIRIAKYTLPKAQGIRVVSKRIAHSLKKAFPQLDVKPTVLPVYVDASAIAKATKEIDLRHQYPQFEQVIVMVGRLEAEKNYKGALDVMKEVLVEKPNVGLVIVGSGSEKIKLQAYADALELGKHVVFAGKQDNVISYYKTADLFLHTSWYEGYGLALMEAALSACPIVTTDVGLIGDVLRSQDSALVCEPGNVSCLARHCIEILNDDARAKKLTHEAHYAASRSSIAKRQYVEEWVNDIMNIM